jgi:hypothetical protein
MTEAPAAISKVAIISFDMQGFSCCESIWLLTAPPIRGENREHSEPVTR